VSGRDKQILASLTNAIVKVRPDELNSVVVIHLTGIVLLHSLVLRRCVHDWRGVAQ
jgi:hypothetical protein